MSTAIDNGELGGELELARLAAIVASSNDAIVSKDLNGIITSWNAAAERIFGFTAGEIIGRHITAIIPEHLYAEETEIISKMRRGERVEHFDTVRVGKDGRHVEVSLTISPLRNSHGTVVGASKIARDITDRKRNEEMQKVLIHELNHRTKNLLATVQTIVSQTFTDATPETTMLFRDRMQALVSTQDLLIETGWRGATLSSMLVSVLAPFTGDGTRIKFALGPEVHLNVRQTNALSMAVHELANNALRYGALSPAGGRVDIAWQAEDGDLIMHWRETHGPTVVLPQRSGFGTLVLKFALEHELKAIVDIDYDPQGLRFSARLPLTINNTPRA